MANKHYSIAEAINNKDLILSPKNDVIFKLLFGTEENLPILRRMLSCILKRDPDSLGDIVIENIELLPEEIEDKFSRLDIKLSSDSSKMNIEMQICYDSDYTDRSLFYGTKLFVSNFQNSSAYSDLKETICINILAFNLFLDTKEYHSHFQILENKRHELMTDKLSFHFFELKKLKNTSIETEELLWLKLINAETEEELKMIENSEVPEIKNAVNKIRELSADDKAKDLAFRREMRLVEKNTLLGNAQKRGHIQGLKEGLKQGQTETKNIFKDISKMIKNGSDDKAIIDIICNNYGLSSDDAAQYICDFRDMM